MSNTDQHLSAEDLERYRNRRLAPADLLAADDHLSHCDICFEALDGPRRRDRILASAAALLRSAAKDDAGHPADEELFDYTDGSIESARRTAIEAHLKECPDCRMQAAGLRSVSLDIAASSGRTFRPRATVTGTRVQSSSFSSLRRPARIGLGIAAGSVLAILLVWGVTAPLRGRISRLEQENARLKQSNADLEKQASSLSDLQDQVAELTRENETLRIGPGENGPGAGQPTVRLSEPGGFIQIDKDGTVRGLEAMGLSDSEAVKAAILTGRVKTPPELAVLRDKPGQLMGSSRAEYGLVAPVATVVAQQRPDFKWREVDRATSYVVSIYSEDGTLVARSEALPASERNRATASKPILEWNPAINLQRGDTYMWQVRAIVDLREVVLPPPAAPNAKFEILPAGRVAEWDRAKQTYRGSHLMQGIVYARLGLLDDAERQFQALANRNPGSEAARKLLASVRSLRPKK